MSSLLPKKKVFESTSLLWLENYLYKKKVIALVKRIDILRKDGCINSSNIYIFLFVLAARIAGIHAWARLSYWRTDYGKHWVRMILLLFLCSNPSFMLRSYIIFTSCLLPYKIGIVHTSLFSHNGCIFC